VPVDFIIASTMQNVPPCSTAHANMPEPKAIAAASTAPLLSSLGGTLILPPTGCPAAAETFLGDPGDAKESNRLIPVNRLACRCFFRDAPFAANKLVLFL
jgi:hypothetical protein